MHEGRQERAGRAGANGASGPAGARPLKLRGSGLTLEQVGEVARQARPVRLAAAAIIRMRGARRVVERALAQDAPAYGINTGLGRLSEVRIAHGHIRELQLNLVRSHACGVGPELDAACVRAMLLLRAQSLATGFSGVRPAVAEMLCALLNRGVLPCVPSQGSVGASGDLAPLAHLALVACGEGEAEFHGQRLPGAEALRRAGLKPLRLQAKEGLSLLNGTQAMLAVGTLAWLDSSRLAHAADVTGALSLEALRGTPAAFNAALNAARGHPGQQQVAAHLRALLAASEIRRSHLHCGRVQDAYSLRCMPQVHGAVRDALAFARATFEREVNAATDNPLVIGPAIVSGGNFHGQPLAMAMDLLAMALATLAGIAERRIERLVNPGLSQGLPAFLSPEPGLHSGLMLAQVTAAALVADTRLAAHPASIDSLPTSAGKEDFVSMGMGAALKLRRAVDNTANLLAIELMAARHALDHLQPLRPGRKLVPVLAAARAAIAPLTADRVLAPDIAAARTLILNLAL